MLLIYSVSWTHWRCNLSKATYFRWKGRCRATCHPTTAGGTTSRTASRSWSGSCRTRAGKFDTSCDQLWPGVTIGDRLLPRCDQLLPRCNQLLPSCDHLWSMQARRREAESGERALRRGQLHQACDEGERRPGRGDPGCEERDGRTELADRVSMF